MNVIFHQEVMTFCFVMGEKALRVGQRSLGHTPSCGYMERWGRGVGVRREGWEGGWEGEEGGETGGQLDEDGRKHGRIKHCLHVEILWVLYFERFTQFLL